MSSPTIMDFLFDDQNEEEMGRHGLTVDRVMQLLENPHLIVTNRIERRAKYLVIGKDRGGACIAVPVEPTHDPTLWRPVTAWRCKDSELARLAKEV